MLPVALCLVRFCYGLLFSSSKLSITFSFLDEVQLYFEQWLHKGWHSFLPTAETRQICSAAVCATCKAREWLPQFHVTLFTSVSSFVPKNELQQWLQHLEHIYFFWGGSISFTWKCHEKWDNGFVIKCNWYLHCNSDKDIYLIKNSIWRKNNLPYLKFPTASIFFFKIRSACSKNTN